MFPCRYGRRNSVNHPGCGRVCVPGGGGWICGRETFLFSCVRVFVVLVEGLCWQALGLLVPVGSTHCCCPPPAYQPNSLLGALPTYVVGNLILKRASRLDAFSGYHFRT